jgi:hypothetical protein
MRFSRTVLTAAAAFAALSATAYAQPSPVPAPAAAASQFTDAERAQYGAALKTVGELSRARNGAQPTEAQRNAMVKAVTDAGLTPERFNAIATAAGSDDMLKARIGVASTPASPAGSVAAGVTDAEATNFVKAMAAIEAIGAGASPTADQQKAQQEAVVNAGLTAERFNAISTAAHGDERLRARLALAKAQLG